GGGVAEEGGGVGGGGGKHRRFAHLVEERKLVREFRIELAVRQVAARGHIEIVYRDRIAQSGAFAEHRRDVSAIALAAEDLHLEALEGNARDDRHPMVALLSVERDVFIAEPLEALERKL